MSLISVLINCPTQEVADRLAETLVEERLAACSNAHGKVSSRYHWQGKVEADTEVSLIVKSRESLFEAICQCVRENHPDDTPCILGTRIDLVEPKYEAWLLAETRE